MAVLVERRGTVYQLIVDDKIKLTGSQLSVMRELVGMAVLELTEHNYDYHHRTPDDFIEALRHVSAS